jgi:quercetin dioxygenase-like cupin family protein
MDGLGAVFSNGADKAQVDHEVETGWHQHTFDYVTVQQSRGALLLQASDGSETHVDYEDGRTVSWAAPIEHNAINISDVEVRVLEIEYKST